MVVALGQPAEIDRQAFADWAARRFPDQKIATPIRTSNPLRPMILVTARSLFGSSGGGNRAMAMVAVVVRKPTIAATCATGLPPGTWMTPGPANPWRR